VLPLDLVEQFGGLLIIARIERPLCRGVEGVHVARDVGGVALAAAAGGAARERDGDSADEKQCGGTGKLEHREPQ
jgi:hypothetical protein